MGAQAEEQETLSNSGAGNSDFAPFAHGFSWPQLQLDVPPRKLYHFRHQFRTGSNPNNFLKSLKWSPDGSSFMTSSDDNTLRLFGLPDTTNTDANGDAYMFNDSEDSYVSGLIVNEGESVYDYCWYPYMVASDPTSCVFACTTRDHPVHLWDAISGELRCTYRAYDAKDEITAAFSVAFNPSGSKLFAGYNKLLRVFNLHRPGRDFEQHSTLQGNKEGQSGIVSCISFCPTHSGMLAAGSYDQTIAVYAEANMELLYVLHGQAGGVTHVLFSKDGNYLYSGGRKDPFIMCWDIRNTSGIVYKLYRSTEHTNQRVLFDIEPCGRHLGTGGEDGQVHIYDLQTGLWASSYQAASDTVNSFSFHPSSTLAATSSGHRRFVMPDSCEENLVLSGDENCATVWEIPCTSTVGYPANLEDDDSKAILESEDRSGSH